MTRATAGAQATAPPSLVSASIYSHGMVSESVALGESLRSVIGSIVRAVGRDKGLPEGQAGALGQLDREGPATTAELASRANMRHQSMTKIVNQLLNRNEIQVTPHPTDRRALRLTITPTGREVLNRDRLARARFIAGVIDAEFTPEQRDALKHAIPLLRIIADSAPERRRPRSDSGGLIGAPLD